jgi:hypothetical protein
LILFSSLSADPASSTTGLLVLLAALEPARMPVLCMIIMSSAALVMGLGPHCTTDPPSASLLCVNCANALIMKARYAGEYIERGFRI